MHYRAMTQARVLVFWLGLAACTGAGSGEQVALSPPTAVPARGPALPRAEPWPALPSVAPAEIDEEEIDEEAIEEEEINEPAAVVDSHDSDVDDVVDALDRCPDAPEDLDAFEDTDGCPDPDVDVDPVLDVPDRCPDAPGAESGDNDGCPEPAPEEVGTIE